MQQTKMSIGDYPISLLEKLHGEAMSVVDPVGQFSGSYALHIPWAAVEETEGFHRFLRNQHPHPSLCMLFQNGRCRAHLQCNQVHADPVIVNMVRESGRTLRQSTCCRFHGGRVSPSEEQTSVVMVTHAGAYVTIPMERTEATAYLDNLMVQAANNNAPKAFFQMSYVCRLHQKRRCGYAKQCGHVHICREYWQSLYEAYPWLHNEPDPSNRNPKHNGPAGPLEDGPVITVGPLPMASSAQAAASGGLTATEALLQLQANQKNNKTKRGTGAKGQAGTTTPPLRQPNFTLMAPVGVATTNARFPVFQMGGSGAMVERDSPIDADLLAALALPSSPSPAAVGQATGAGLDTTCTVPPSQQMNSPPIAIARPATVPNPKMAMPTGSVAFVSSHHPPAQSPSPLQSMLQYSASSDFPNSITNYVLNDTQDQSAATIVASDFFSTSVSQPNTQPLLPANIRSSPSTSCILSILPTPPAPLSTTSSVPRSVLPLAETPPVVLSQQSDVRSPLAELNDDLSFIGSNRTDSTDYLMSSEECTPPKSALSALTAFEDLGLTLTAAAPVTTAGKGGQDEAWYIQFCREMEQTLLLSNQ